MNIAICCPSYRRPKVETLEYLPMCRVYVDLSEADEYIKQNEGANIVVCDDGVQGNVARVRNHILEKEFENGNDAVCIVDDDMRGIFRFDVDAHGYGYKKTKVEKDYFLAWLMKYTVLCKEFGYKLWGGECQPRCVVV